MAAAEGDDSDKKEGKKKEYLANFWSRQQDLIGEMKASNANAIKIENRNKFRSLQVALLGDTAFCAALIFSLLWLTCNNPFVAFSYMFGSLFGLAYTYGLGETVYARLVWH